MYSTELIPKVKIAATPSCNSEKFIQFPTSTLFDDHTTHHTPHTPATHTSDLRAEPHLRPLPSFFSPFIFSRCLAVPLTTQRVHLLVLPRWLLYTASEFR